MITGHYIRENAASRVPNRFLFLDTEARESVDGWTRTQTWRMAVTAFDHRDNAASEWRPPEYEYHATPEGLWDYVDAHTKRRARTILVAHNLAYDLRIAQAFRHLGRLGWGVHRLSVHDRSVGAVFRRDDRSLVLCDSMAWLPMGLAKVAGLMHTEKVNLPRFDDPDDEWEARCRQDVVILRAAVLDLLAWIETDDLGNWQRTGAGQAWATWRHRFYTHRVLVHSDERARDAETESAYTGRCEAWRHDKLDGGPWHEWDMSLCYPRVARDTRLPAQLMGHRLHPSMRWIRHMHPSNRLLAHATVTTVDPVLPTRVDGYTVWPVGTFAGWWWDVELMAAEDAGATITADECYRYRSSPVLADWATWVIGLVESPPAGCNALRQAAAKHQARALIGRFGTRYTLWEPWGKAHPDAHPLESIYIADDATSGKVLTLGDEAFIGLEQRYGADAVPSIMAAVMAEARCRLWRAMRAVGPDHLAYVDTDSVIVDPTGHARMRLWATANEGDGWRVKDEYRHLTILGPRQMIANGVGRIAGVPTAAERFGPTSWFGETWEGFTTALQAGHDDRVIIRPASWTVEGTDRRRVHLADGRTAPVAAPETVGDSAIG